VTSRPAKNDVAVQDTGERKKVGGDCQFLAKMDGKFGSSPDFGRLGSIECCWVENSVTHSRLRKV
jgi:hypothetical protein